ncbi:MAG: slipin family protein [Clostridium sp.]|jgi:regulator of protease activity HflC (stomatin/prohibitin superfamily)|nr:slipin family protein [Clostridium sp.]
MKKIIYENERGLLFKNGQFIKMLMPGKYTYLGKSHCVVSMDTSERFAPNGYNNNVFLKNKELADSLVVAEVPDQKIALHFVNGRFTDALTSGEYVYWQLHEKHEFKMVDITEPLIGAEVPEYLFARMQKNVYSRMEIKEHQKGRLFYDGKFVKLLDEGTYYFWNNGVKVEVGLVDTRILQMNIQGQEMLTLDKVALRINFVCRYKIADYVRIYTEIDNYEEQLRVAAQLALREYIGHGRLDELLENKEQLADFVLTRLKSKESEWFVSFLDAGVKDIILPGEIRDIMNTVLLAEKKAQANVITRREEVASTRSLLNTAKLMEENQTLMRLKEMEYLEKICDNVGNITVNGGSDLLGQLTAILKGGAA